MRVLGDLRFERIEPGKFAFRADEFDERDSQMAAIEIGVDVSRLYFFDLETGSAIR